MTTALSAKAIWLGSPPIAGHQPDPIEIVRKITKLENDIVEGVTGEIVSKIINLINDGSGTADAIQATSIEDDPATAYGGLYLLNIVADNTDAVTVSINSGTPKSLVSNTNSALVSGYLTAGMAVLMVDDGTNYRLLSYGDASVIEAAVTALYNDFTDKYLGSYTSDPSGSHTEGATYWNLSTSTMRVYTSGGWDNALGIPATSVNWPTAQAVTKAVASSITLDVAAASANAIYVSLGGVRQWAGVDYSLAGDGVTLTWLNADLDGVDGFIQVMGRAVDSGVPADDSIGADQINAAEAAAIKSKLGISSGSAPSGAIMDFAGSTEPTGWVFCYGQALSRTTESDLFAAIGTTYGSGDGSTTFNVPDCRGRIGVGRDDMGGTAANRITSAGSGIDGTDLGAVGGSQEHTLTEAEMPEHTHESNTASRPNIVSTDEAEGTMSMQRFADPGGSGDTGFAGSPNFAASDPANMSAGNGDAHNNVQPSIIFNQIIKL